MSRQVILPPDFKSDINVAQELLRTFAAGCFPVSLELIGSGGKVTIQVTCSEFDADRVFGAVADYAPDATVVNTSDLLADNFEGTAPLIVDWGLSDEFFLPVGTHSSFRLDTYIPLVAALARAGEGEAICYQVLIEPIHNPWRAAILHAVAPNGSPLFEDAPEFVPGARRKTESPLYACLVRTAVHAESDERQRHLMRGLPAFITQFKREGLNELIPLANDGYPDSLHLAGLLSRTSYRTGMILSLEELVGLAHLPDASVRNEALVREQKKTKAVPAIAAESGISIGENAHRGVRKGVRLGDTQRLAHTMIVGASGTGKSSLLVSMIAQDIESGAGLAVLDPHGDLIEDVLARVPDHRRDDVIVFDPADESYSVGFNVLAARTDVEKHLLASDLVGIFQRLSTSWGDSMSTVLANAALAVVEHPDGGTLIQLRRFLVDERYRKGFLAGVTDAHVRFFWEKEWPLIGARSIGPILTRLNTFLRPKLIRQVVGQRSPRLQLRDVMGSRKIFLAKLSQGLIGNENAYLLGSLLLTGFLQQAFARQALSKEERTPFWLYLDEAEHFLTPSVASLLTEARKYGVGLHLAFQMLAQLRSTPTVESALLGSAEVRIAFRVGDDDARKLADTFAGFDAADLRSLHRGEALARVGPATNDFTLQTVLPTSIDDDMAQARRDACRSISRDRYAAPVSALATELEEAIADSGIPEPATAQPVHQEPPVAPRAEARSASPSQLPRAQPELLGKGGQEHRYLQHVLKRLGEERGFRAVIEEPVQDGQIDVVLRREGLAIACEISVTTPTEHELANIRKCTAGDYTEIWLLVTDRKRRASIEAAAQTAAGTRPFRCMCPEDLVAALDGLAAPPTAEQVVSGYKVKVTRKAATSTDAERRRSAIANVLARSLLKDRKP